MIFSPEIALIETGFATKLGKVLVFTGFCLNLLESWRETERSVSISAEFSPLMLWLDGVATFLPKANTGGINMELCILRTASASTVTGSAMDGHRVEGADSARREFWFAGPARSILCKNTVVGAIEGTVTVYQRVKDGASGFIDRLLATFTVSQSTTVQAIDLINAGQTFYAVWTPSANPSGDTVTVVVEG